VRTAFQQNDAQLRFDWGLAGALAVTEPPGTAAVVVDVLSFATTVSVAGDLRLSIFPFPWRDDRAAAFAESVGATLAGGRRQPGPSLSPASLRAIDRQAGKTAATDQPATDQPGTDPPATDQPGTDPPATDQPGTELGAGEFGRLVLPSPNGASICYALAERRPPRLVLTGCLRNATAIANWLVHQLATGRLSAVGLVAAGERWPDGSLRPAVEDLWGAGAILARIAGAAPQLRLAPEASAAAAAFGTVEAELAAQLAGCASGRELIEDGFAEDVAIAAELDGSTGVPVLDGDRFRIVRS
jgi:2-phosphosulfolactate phosphatase